MDNIYLGFTVFLIVLAVFDLISGVSNDAVNFLNSAIGAKVATFRTIIIVAAVGVFIGASMSNGMMDVARHGVFHPSMFSFREVFFIFLAVMISDVILLDAFNTLGMPTSTTVSMVFELLGGTCAMALVKSCSEPGVNMMEMMNTGKALSMIIAIFVSVPIAFFSGTVVQYIARLVFTFSYKGPELKWKIGITGGIAATAIIWFMLIKGLKNVAFISPDTLGWIQSHGWLICLCCAVVTGIMSHILHLLKVNVFKVLVLFGTFGLAMAFAGNDLVNFIGVPLAGLDAFRDYTANGGGNAAGYMMSSLDGPATTSPLILIAAGAVMVISLATSKKAFNVVNTSVGLSKQGDGDEMFGSSRVARLLVRAAINAGTVISDFIPKKFRNWADTRFKNEETLPEGAAFDEIRATVNLVLASLLIALGTSLKLPLSTTYVTFMVAMGSSLADRAWGRDSAVFRITGVISVIGGWFITAGAAFILSFLTGLLMCAGGMVAAGLLIALAIFLLIRSHIEFTRKKAEDKGDVLFEKILSSNDKEETLRLFSQHFNGNMASFLEFANETYLNITDGFVCENLGKLRKAAAAFRKERMELKQIRRKDMLCIRRIDSGVAIEKNTWVHLGSNSCEDILYCLKRMSDPCEEHIDNNFAPLPEERIKEFVPMRDTLLFLLRRASDIISKGDFRDSEKVREQCEKFKESLSALRKMQINRMQSEQENITVSYVYLTMLQETQEIANGIRHLLRATSHFSENGLEQ
ncbi:MAG: inorganic phosphate transporter [Candidatus Cryptobacteroides sp.]